MKPHLPLYLSRDEVRAFDRRATEQLGVPGVVLMENAGRNVADVLRSLGVRGPVVICCGKGNNGGDGFVIARHLDLHGIPVRVLLFCRPDDITGDAAIHFRIIEKIGLPIQIHAESCIDQAVLQQELQGADWIVDALFGTGLSGPIRPPLDTVIATINASGLKVLAVDIPSGLDCDTGKPLGPTVEAEYTVTFVAQKKGFANIKSKQWTGGVHVADIGVSVDQYPRE